MLSLLRRDANARVLNGFAPQLILSISAETKDTSEWLAFCFPADDVTYQINGAGHTATLTAGTIRVLAENTRTIAFSGISEAACEVM